MALAAAGRRAGRSVFSRETRGGDGELALTQAHNVPLLWWQRIIVNHKKIKGWHMTPSHYLWQDLTTVWLDE